MYRETVDFSKFEDGIIIILSMKVWYLYPAYGKGKSHFGKGWPDRHGPSDESEKRY